VNAESHQWISSYPKVIGEWWHIDLIYNVCKYLLVNIDFYITILVIVSNADIIFYCLEIMEK